MKKKSHLGLILFNIGILLVTLLISGCATILSGSDQKLKLQSTDVKFDVYSWDGKLVASPKVESDSTVTVHRPNHGLSYMIRMQKDGYCPQYWLTMSKGNPVIWGNLILGGLIGIMIDGASGAAYSIEPTVYNMNNKETQLCKP